jgi:hypothetical protein
MEIRVMRGISAGDRNSCALQRLQQGLESFPGRLIDREVMICLALQEDDGAVPALVGAGNGHGQETHVKAPIGAIEDFKDAAIEGDNAVRSDPDFEQIHDGILTY